MKWDVLERINEAPTQGNMLLYLRNKKVFGQYSAVRDVEMKIGEDDILELHLFDSLKEYRAVASEGSKSKNGCIEWIADFESDGCFSDDCLLEDGAKMTIINHISYDETGMACIDDYRLVVGKG